MAFGIARVTASRHHTVKPNIAMVLKIAVRIQYVAVAAVKIEIMKPVTQLLVKRIGSFFFANNEWNNDR